MKAGTMGVITSVDIMPLERFSECATGISIIKYWTLQPTATVRSLPCSCLALVPSPWFSLRPASIT